MTALVVLAVAAWLVTVGRRWKREHRQPDDAFLSMRLALGRAVASAQESNNPTQGETK